MFTKAKGLIIAGIVEKKLNEFLTDENCDTVGEMYKRGVSEMIKACRPIVPTVVKLVRDNPDEADRLIGLVQQVKEVFEQDKKFYTETVPSTLKKEIEPAFDNLNKVMEGTVEELFDDEFTQPLKEMDEEIKAELKK